jgi:uncharacterized protein (TIGR03435 family)
MSDTRVELGSIPLKFVIQRAYQVEAYQISGPDWLVTAHFDILAKLPAGATKEQIPEMLQSLLADRFGLVVHREPKEQPIYALIVGKDGPKLKAAESNNQLDETFMNGRSIVMKTATPDGDGFWTTTMARSEPGGGTVFDGPRITMAAFARTLQSYVDFPVMDMTALNGPFHVRLDVPVRSRLAGLSPAVTPDPTVEVTIFSSVQKLGLALEKRKVPVENLVIDHVEKVPTEN